MSSEAGQIPESAVGPVTLRPSLFVWARCTPRWPANPTAGPAHRLPAVRPAVGPHARRRPHAHLTPRTTPHDHPLHRRQAPGRRGPDHRSRARDLPGPLPCMPLRRLRKSHPELLATLPDWAARIIDTTHHRPPLTLDQIEAEFVGAHAAGQDVARPPFRATCPSTAPSLSNCARLERRSIPYTLTPGVPGFFSAACPRCWAASSTVPGVAQRCCVDPPCPAAHPKMPAGEKSWASFAATGSNIGHPPRQSTHSTRSSAELLPHYYGADLPGCVGHGGQVGPMSGCWRGTLGGYQDPNWPPSPMERTGPSSSWARRPRRPQNFHRKLACIPLNTGGASGRAEALRKIPHHRGWARVIPKHITVQAINALNTAPTLFFITDKGTEKRTTSRGSAANCSSRYAPNRQFRTVTICDPGQGPQPQLTTMGRGGPKAGTSNAPAFYEALFTQQLNEKRMRPPFLVWGDPSLY